MPHGPGAKAEVLSILAFRAYPVNRGFSTGRVEVTENPVLQEVWFVEGFTRRRYRLLV
jgi:hypothetical protein